MREGRLWQLRFWDHIIRDETDMNRHIDYIHFNPVKHKMAARPSENEYSSFRDYIKMDFIQKNGERPKYPNLPGNVENKEVKTAPCPVPIHPNRGLDLRCCRSRLAKSEPRPDESGLRGSDLRRLPVTIEAFGFFQRGGRSLSMKAVLHQ